MITDTELEIERLKLQKAYFEAAWALSGLGRPKDSTTDFRAAWTTLVEQKVKSGLSRVEAIKAAGRERPDLYEQQRVLKQEAAPSPAQNPARERWEQAIAERMSKGMTRFEAIKQVMRAKPALFAAYNEERR